MAVLTNLDGKKIQISTSAFLATSAQLIGDVEVGDHSSIWYSTVLRGDVMPIKIGKDSNIQDGTVIHCDSGSDGAGGFPTIIGDDCLEANWQKLPDSIADLMLKAFSKEKSA